MAGLVEWPVVLVGSFDERFLEIPPEVVRATIRANQKCFVLRRPGERERSPTSFVLVSNIEARDGGKAIVGGNERVVRARLSDARHFWETDQRPLPDYARRLPASRSTSASPSCASSASSSTRSWARRASASSASRPWRASSRRWWAPIRTSPPARRELAKADLVTEMVGEFPEVQGLMGRRYAELQGEHPSVAAAIEEHYKPQGPSDRVPSDPVSVAVALADKLDTLVGFWAIDEKPTGSKDPYALRRAALGVIRIVLENEVRLALGRRLRPRAVPDCVATSTAGPRQSERSAPTSSPSSTTA